MEKAKITGKRKNRESRNKKKNHRPKTVFTYSCQAYGFQLPATRIWRIRKRYRLGNLPDKS